MSQVEVKTSKQKKKAEMISTWQSEVSCDRNLTQLSQGELHDLLSTIPKQINPKKYSNSSYKQELFPKTVITFICKLLSYLIKNGEF